MFWRTCRHRHDAAMAYAGPRVLQDDVAERVIFDLDWCATSATTRAPSSRSTTRSWQPHRRRRALRRAARALWPGPARVGFALVSTAAHRAGRRGARTGNPIAVPQPAARHEPINGLTIACQGRLFKGTVDLLAALGMDTESSLQRSQAALRRHTVITMRPPMFDLCGGGRRGPRVTGRSAARAGRRPPREAAASILS